MSQHICQPIDWLYSSRITLRLQPRPFYSMKLIPEYTACEYLQDLNERLKISRQAALSNLEKMKETLTIVK